MRTLRALLERYMMMIGPYHEVVSLGRACQPAYQLRRVLNISRAHVFDWLITDDVGIRGHISARATDVLVLERLQRDEDGVVCDRQTGTKFLHDFKKDVDIPTAWAAAVPRFATLVARWQKLMASNSTVLFIRQHAWDCNPVEAADALLATLQAAAPRLRIRLLYLSEPEWTPDLPDRPNLIHRQMPQHPEGLWTGCDEIWDKRLHEAIRLDPPPNPGRQKWSWAFLGGRSDRNPLAKEEP